MARAQQKTAAASGQQDQDKEPVEMDIAPLLRHGMETGDYRGVLEMVRNLLQQGQVQSAAISNVLSSLPEQEQEFYAAAGLPALANIARAYPLKQQVKMLTDALAEPYAPYQSRFTVITHDWMEEPGWMDEPEEDRPQRQQDLPQAVFEIDQGAGGTLARGPGEEEPQPQPPDSAPLRERMNWLETEARRKKRILDETLSRLELEKVLLGFFLGSVTGGEVIRNRELQAFERMMREGGMQNGWRRRVLDRLMENIRSGNANAIKSMLARYGWLRRKIMGFFVRRFHLIGALLAVLDLAPLLRHWSRARNCRNRLNELDDLRWRWMREGNIAIGPGETAQLGPFVDPTQLGTSGQPCEHTVTYIFSWEDTDGNDHESVLAGPRPLQAPPEGSNTDGMPAGALTDSQTLPTPQIPANFAKGYIIYEFTTACPGRQPIVSRLFAVAVHQPLQGQSGQGD